LEIPYDPEIPLLIIYPNDMESLPQDDTCTPIFIAALFTIGKMWNQPRCPSAGKKKKWYSYAMEYYSAIKKKKRNLLFAATLMELENIMLSETSQTQKGKHHMLSLVYGNQSVNLVV
jgi:hypothetical protein